MDKYGIGDPFELTRINNQKVAFMARKPELGTAEYWRAAYRELWEGKPVEIRMPQGELDEIVGHGGFHVEKMDTNCWFFDLGGCAFFVSGKDVKLTPRDCESWVLLRTKEA